MLDFSEVQLGPMAIHYVGNKGRGEDLVLSRNAFQPKEELVRDLLIKYFLSPFKGEVFYNFTHESDLKLNEVYKFASSIFDQRGDFFLQGANIAERLYDMAEHPRVKSGELYIVYFSNCVVDGEQADAIGLFRSESKETFLKVYCQDANFEVDAHEGININKLDKGCLIFNTESDKGYKVCIVDNNNKSGEALYWKDDFLGVKQRDDDFYRTQEFMNVCRGFCEEVLTTDNNVAKPEQLAVKNKSVEFFKSKAKEGEAFSVKEFEKEVMEVPEVIQAFRDYRQDYVKQHDITDFEESFDVSEAAVKNNSKFFRAVLKLDKNFHVYVHGKHDYIERGYDEDKSMNYYKLFYHTEA
jgi:hypothetical protein